MIRVFSILSKTLAASFAVHNRFPKAVHYSSSSSRHPIVRLLQWYEFYRKPPPVLYHWRFSADGQLVKVFLDYYDIPYKVEEIDLFNMMKLVLSGELPILILDGEELHDTSVIIDRLRQKFPLKEKTGSTSADFEEIEWRWWAEVYLYIVLEVNMFQTFSETLEAMDYITGHHNFMVKPLLKCVGAATFYFTLKSLYGNNDKRATLYHAAETWVDALYGREFRGGSKPNLADMAVFGVLRPIRDMKCCKDMVEHTRIGEWYTRMENAVGKSSRIEF